jgi:hypothetical protein
MNKFISFIFFLNLLCFKSFSQQFTIVGPQNDCAKGISKNVHTDSKDFVIDGYAKLKITTQQHRFFDNSKIYDAINGNLIWEWKGESFNDTWYKKEHTIEINAKKIRVEFTQGYRDPFCNGFIKVEKISSDNQSTSQNIIEYNDLKIISVQNYKSALGRLEGKIINGTINNIDQESFIRHDYGNQQIEISTKYDHYKGGYINNKKNGSGIYESKGNFIYEGQFKDNEITGNGLMIYYTTDDTYEGGLVKGNRNGKGIYKWKTGSSSGRTYNGDWENGKMHGYGLLTNPDGSKLYEGAFYKGEYHGFGVLYSANNSRTGGIWQTGNLLHSLPAFVNNPKFYDFDIEYGYTSFVNDQFHVKFNSKKGVINIKGEEIIPTKYDVLEFDWLEGKHDQPMKIKYITIGRIFSSDIKDVYDYYGNFLGNKSHNADMEQANKQHAIALNKIENEEKQISSSNNQTINPNFKNGNNNTVKHCSYKVGSLNIQWKYSDNRKKCKYCSSILSCRKYTTSELNNHKKNASLHLEYHALTKHWIDTKNHDDNLQEKELNDYHAWQKTTGLSALEIMMANQTRNASLMLDLPSMILSGGGLFSGGELFGNNLLKKISLYEVGDGDFCNRHHEDLYYRNR